MTKLDADRVPVEVLLDADLLAQIPADRISETLNGLLRSALTPTRPQNTAVQLQELARERAAAEAEEAAETVKWEAYLADDPDAVIGGRRP